MVFSLMHVIPIYERIGRFYDGYVFHSPHLACTSDESVEVIRCCAPRGYHRTSLRGMIVSLVCAIIILQWFALDCHVLCRCLAE